MPAQRKKDAHVGTDLREQHGRRRFADAGDGRQLVDSVAKGSGGLSRLRLQFLDRAVELINLAQVQLEHEAMMFRHPSSQRLEQLRAAGHAELAGHQFGQAVCG